MPDYYSSRQMRVFISSTFRDMQRERDNLVKNIFPQLRKICEERAVTFTEIDLRWGITQEENDNNKTLQLCLEEIERSRPYFIGLLGERYGWIPSADKIPEELKVQDKTKWIKDYFSHSVTEMEIVHGVLNNTQMENHAYFYFRNRDYVNHLPEGEVVEDYIDQTENEKQKLRALKNKIREKQRSGYVALTENYNNPSDLGEFVLQDFTQLIDHLYPVTEIPDALTRETMLHEAYARSKRLGFVGRENLLQLITEYVNNSYNTPLIFTGESGCGKSALLAEWVSQYRTQNPDILVVQHYIGSTPDSAGWTGLVVRLLSIIKKEYNIIDEMPNSPDELEAALMQWCTKIAGGKKMLIVLDALNQLHNNDEKAWRLDWLPGVFPQNIQVIVSTLEGKVFGNLKQRSHWQIINVPLFTPEEIIPAAKAFLKIYSKNFETDILRVLAEEPLCLNALYLRTVLDEMRQVNMRTKAGETFKDKLKQKLQVYLQNKTLPELFNQIITRWQTDYDDSTNAPDLVKNVLCLIAASHSGLSETELLEILGKDGSPLPRKYFTPFYLAIENSITLKNGLLNFGHDYLRQAVNKRWNYWSSDWSNEMYRFIGILIDYFETFESGSQRKVTELPIHYSSCGQYDKLKDFLLDWDNFSAQNFFEGYAYWLLLKNNGFDIAKCFAPKLAALSANDDDDCLKYYNVFLLYFAFGMYREALTLGEVVMAHRKNILRDEDVPDYLYYFSFAPLLTQIYAQMGLNQKSLEVGKELVSIIEKLYEIEEDSRDTHFFSLMSLNSVVSSYLAMDMYIEALELGVKVFTLSKKCLGEENDITIAGMGNLAEIYLKANMYTDALNTGRKFLTLSKRIFGEEHMLPLKGLSLLGLTYFKMEMYTEALGINEKALELSKIVLGDEHPDTILRMRLLADAYYSLEKYKETLALNEKAFFLSLKVLGEEHHHTLICQNNLANSYFIEELFEFALGLNKNCLVLRKKVLGREHPDTVESMERLARSYSSMQMYPEALDLRKNIVALSKKILGIEHITTLRRMRDLDEAYVDLSLIENTISGIDQKVLALRKKIVVLYKKVLGETHLHTLESMTNLANWYYRLGLHKEASDLKEKELELRKSIEGKEDVTPKNNENSFSVELTAKVLETRKITLEINKEILGDEHCETLESMDNLAETFSDMEMYQEALNLSKEVLEIRKRILGTEHPDTLESMNNIADIYSDMKMDKEALDLSKEVLATRKRVLGEEHPDSLSSMNNLAVIYSQMEMHKEASALSEKGLELSKRILGENHFITSIFIKNLSEGFNVYLKRSIN